MAKDRSPVPFRLREMLALARVSQMELARRIGVDRCHVSSLAAGRISPTWATACRIADALGVSVGEFQERGSTKKKVS